MIQSVLTGTSGWGTEHESVLVARVSRVGYLSPHPSRAHQLHREARAEMLPAKDDRQKPQNAVACVQVALKPLALLWERPV